MQIYVLCSTVLSSNRNYSMKFGSSINAQLFVCLNIRWENVSDLNSFNLHATFFSIFAKWSPDDKRWSPVSCVLPLPLGLLLRVFVWPGKSWVQFCAVGHLRCCFDARDWERERTSRACYLGFTWAGAVEISGRRKTILYHAVSFLL